MKKGNLATQLEKWFAVVKRPMPWRSKPSPYVCWLSEIMMQQTTYAAVLPYYERFLKRFPTVEKLAAADESEVLKVWEGLGYYARARNLLKAAKVIVQSASIGGGLRPHWPMTATEWATLPGVGPYTAAALSSVLNGERTPVVDGNVARVFARVWMLKDDFSKLPARERLAERLRPEIERCRVPGDFNQAMMELGATVCTPKSPDCAKCPLASICAAHRNGSWADFPVRPTRKTLPVRQMKAVVVMDGKGRVLLVQNREGGLLKGLWELPSVEDSASLSQTFSHFRLELETVRVMRTDARFVDPAKVPLTTATRKALAALRAADGKPDATAST